MRFLAEKIIDYPNYQYLLDGVWSPKIGDLFTREYYQYGKEITDFDYNENNLSLEIFNFLKYNNLLDDSIILSLSGGVDSMVILSILISIRNVWKNFKIYTVSVNYNLRKESYLESEFLKEYCNYHKVHSMIVEVNDSVEDNGNRKFKNMKRSDFEESSLNLRFDAYKSLIDKFNCKGVLLGHHKDDITENIFTNIMKGHSILDLEVMKKNGTRKGVRIFRPLLNFHKFDIYKFSEKNKIPYFLDTTPTWSRRGKMRNEIFPMFSSIFGKNWNHKLNEIGEQSNNWRNTIEINIIEPWIKEVYFFEHGFIIPIKYTEDENLWIYFVPKLFFKINCSTIKRKSILLLFSCLKNSVRKKKVLDSGFAFIIRENHVVIFDEKKFRYNESKFSLENLKLI